VIDRDDIGSWLNGPDLSMRPGDWPGKRLGLPQEGPGSVAPHWKRFLSLCIDWGLCLLISTAFFHGDSWVTLGLFLVENWVLQSTLGYTIGQRVLRVRLLGPGGTRRNPGWILVRVVLLALVIPAVVYNGDRRGLHDLAANVTVVRM
jgi:uncharacterized RDD family membrane protein YckC